MQYLYHMYSRSGRLSWPSPSEGMFALRIFGLVAVIMLKRRAYHQDTGSSKHEDCSRPVLGGCAAACFVHYLYMCVFVCVCVCVCVYVFIVRVIYLCVYVCVCVCVCECVCVCV